MTTTQEKLFKRETLDLTNIFIYTQNDRKNKKCRLSDLPNAKTIVNEILYSPMLWTTPTFSSGYVTKIQIKGTRIYDALCTYTGVRTYFYKLVNSEFGCMYQKRPYPQKDFLVIYANLTQMFNDAICTHGANTNVFNELDCDIGSGVSRYELQRSLLEFYKTSKRPRTISETTSGMLEGVNLRYNIFVRNQPRLGKDGKPLKCTKKLLKLYGERGTVAVYSGECTSPLKVIKHDSFKLVSENGKYSYTVDIITLYSEEQDMYTLYVPNSVIHEDYGVTNKFYGLHLKKSSVENEIEKVLSRIQKHLNSK